MLLGVKDLTVDIDENLPSWKRHESLWIADKYSVPCENKSGKVVTMCPYNTTCCDDLVSNTGQGCCLVPKAVPCGDGMHCCPAGYECDPGCSIPKCSCRKMNYSLVTENGHPRSVKGQTYHEMN
ncbi:hypothetical protein OS493_040095 [Desmophyllum pertusum]|uniref:Granulins domain-containing protein n=1 Tax=Desmophyllum pertusum TaxID=174260 RepID=A0A9W9ZIJ7_9CNID|nr:hypothetical protein OS493_040095 [Desmophyllum pertusum]